jgi:hypothetical protein
VEVVEFLVGTQTPLEAAQKLNLLVVVAVDITGQV